MLQRTWKEDLRSEFKNMRRPLTSAEDVLEAKRKFSAKRPQTHQDEVEAVKRRKSAVISFCIVMFFHSVCTFNNLCASLSFQTNNNWLITIEDNLQRTFDIMCTGKNNSQPDPVTA